MFMQLFSHVIIISDYYLNVSRYAAQCENKAKVAMHCNGMCQMTKKLKEEDKRENQNPEKRIQSQSDLFIANRSAFAVVLPEFNIDKKSYPIMVGEMTIDRPHSIFIPPSA